MMLNKKMNGHSNGVFTPRNTLRAVIFGVYSIGNLMNPVFAGSLAIGAPPAISSNDDAGVDLLTGLPQFQQSDLSIGTGVSFLSHTIATYGEYFWGFRDDFHAGVGRSSPIYFKASIGHSSQIFQEFSGRFINIRGDGATIVVDSNGIFTYTRNDGTQVVSGGDQSTRITYPNGFEITVHGGNEVTSPYNGFTTGRRQSVTTNTGLQFKYNYKTNVLADLPLFDYPGLSPNAGDASLEFHAPTSIVAINNAVEYCDPLANSCSLNKQWPTVQYSWPTAESMFAANGQGTGEAVFTVTDSSGSVTKYKHERFRKKNPCFDGTVASPVDVEGNIAYTTRLTHVLSDTHETRELTYKSFEQYAPVDAGSGSTKTSCSARYWLIDKVKIGNAEWTYNHTQPNTPYRSAGHSSGPRGSNNIVMANGGGETVWRLSAHAPGIAVFYTQNRANRPFKSASFGRETEYKYDSRGNVTESREKALSGSGLSDIVLTAGYPTTCSNLKTCNQPAWIKDAMGNQTDFTYHAQSGGLLTVTQPADSHGIRPQTRNTYQQKYAWFKNSTGGYVQASSPVWLLAKTSSCIKGASSGNGCALANDEVFTTFDYGPNSGPNNLFLRGQVVTSQGQSRRTCFSYDIYGNKISETSPKANLSTCQ